MNDEQLLTLWKSAFGSDTHSCRGECTCGRPSYDFLNHWDWEEGELEELRNNHNAIGLGGAVSFVEFEGPVYVSDCTCWHSRAIRIAKFLFSHWNGVADFLNNYRAAEIATARARKAVNKRPTTADLP